MLEQVLWALLAAGVLGLALETVLSRAEARGSGSAWVRRGRVLEKALAAALDLVLAVGSVVVAILVVAMVLVK